MVKSPSNNKAGYVIRRILRRAVRYGYTFLGFNEPFLYELTPLIAANFGDIFPEVRGNKSSLQKWFLRKENGFPQNFGNGLKNLDQIKIELKSKNEKVIPGKTSFLNFTIHLDFHWIWLH